MAFIEDKKATAINWLSSSQRDYNKDAAKDNFFAGTWDMDQTNLDAYNPFVQGYAYWIWTKLPKFFSEEMAKKFKAMTEKNFKSFSGLSNITMDTDSVTGGFAGNTYDVATNLKKPDGSFTLKHQEYMGSPIRKLYEYWIYGIRDIETGLATYHGKIANGTLQYSIANHSAEGIYIVTDPSGALGAQSANGNPIEYACYYTNIVPTDIPQDHLNYSAGDHGLTEIDIPFKGVWHRSEKVNTLAKSLLKARAHSMLATFGSYGDGSSMSTALSSTLEKL